MSIKYDEAGRVGEKETIITDQILKKAREGKYRKYWIATLAIFVAYLVCVPTMVVWWAILTESIYVLYLLPTIVPLVFIHIISVSTANKARKGTPGKLLSTLGITGGILLGCSLGWGAFAVTYTTIMSMSFLGLQFVLLYLIAVLSILVVIPLFPLKNALATDGYVDLLKMEDITSFFVQKWGAGSAVPLQEIADYFHVKKDEALRKLRQLIKKGFPATISTEDLVLSDNIASTPAQFCDLIRKKWESAGKVDVATIAKEFTMEPGVMASKLKAWVKKGLLNSLDLHEQSWTRHG
nr:hypothetical protein [Candidatus Sigynarchaeota archaeon]